MHNNKKDMQITNIDEIKLELKALKHPTTRKEFQRREFLLDAVRKYNNDMLDAAIELEEFNMRNYNSSDEYNRLGALSWTSDNPIRKDYYIGRRMKSKPKKNCLILCDLQKGADSDFLLNEYVETLESKLNLDNYDIIISTKFKNIVNSPFRTLLKDYEMINKDDTDLIPYSEDNSDIIFERGIRSIFTSELISYIKDNNIDEIDLVGYDLCTTILNSALDAFNCAYNLNIYVDLCNTAYLKEYESSVMDILKVNVPSYIKKYEEID